jgi:hypothetical protein
VKRYEVVVARRTARGSSYAIYDNVEKKTRAADLGTTRDRSEAERMARRLNEQEERNDASGS